MLRRPALTRIVLAGGIAALALAGCGQLRPQNKHEYFEARLSGSQEVPPVTTSGDGMAEVRFNENTSTIRWKVTYSGLSGPVTGAHLHGPAGPGQNAGVQVPFAGNLNAVPIEGEARLTPQQVNELMSGQWYVNLHTQQNPGGEIRGQLRPRR